MDKLLTIFVFSALFLILNVNQVTAGAIFDVFFDVDVQDLEGDPVEGAFCTLSDPGVGILKSGFTDSNGKYSDTLLQVMTGEIYDVECTVGAIGASQAVTIGFSQTETVSLTLPFTLPQLVGGELIPIDTHSLILAGSQSFSWMIPVLLSGIGIGLFVFRKSEKS